MSPPQNHCVAGDGVPIWHHRFSSTRNTQPYSPMASTRYWHGLLNPGLDPLHEKPSTLSPDSETPSPQRHIITSPSSTFLSSLELSDTHVFDPQIRARLGTAAHFSNAVSSRYRHGLSNPELDQLHENVTLVESLVSRPPVRPSTSIPAP